MKKETKEQLDHASLRDFDFFKHGFRNQLKISIKERFHRAY
jgi:hypothetical protein